MKRALALLLLVCAWPVVAQKITLHEGRGPREGDEGGPPPARVVEPRAIQVNRCVDARGTVVLSDLPCPPVGAAAAAAPSASAAAADVVDITALEARPPRPAPVRAERDAPMSGFLRGLLNGAWKLALLVAGLYALYRLGRHARARYRERFVEPEPLKRAAGPVRIR